MLDRLLAKKTDFATDPNIGADGIDLKRTLGPWGLTALGIGAVIGGGIFVITGHSRRRTRRSRNRAFFHHRSHLFGFCALCYAEFATLIPMSGSSYSYAYATLGEFVAWFIGWNWCSSTAYPPRPWRSAGPAISSACWITSASTCRRHDRFAAGLP